MEHNQRTIQKWLDFMGDPSNGHTPFKTNYTITGNSWVDPNTNITYNPTISKPVSNEKVNASYR
jgi:hypothetical protein